MTTRRTQIYLEDTQRERIERLRTRRGGTMADVVRDALDLYLDADERAARPLAELAPRWVGAWKDREPDELETDGEVRGGLSERARRLGY